MIRSCWWEEERQLGKAGSTGRPSWRMARRSGGKVKSKAASREASSSSVRPCLIGIEWGEEWRWFTTDLA
ncbi:hypothetical protein ACFX13_019253 [Malus domestica]